MAEAQKGCDGRIPSKTLRHRVLLEKSRSRQKALAGPEAFQSIKNTPFARPTPNRLLLFLSAPVLPSSFCRVSMLASSWKRRLPAFLRTSPPFQPHTGIAVLLNPSCSEILSGWPHWISPGLSTMSTKGLEVGEHFVGEKSERKGWVSLAKEC